MTDPNAMTDHGGAASPRTAKGWMTLTELADYAERCANETHDEPTALAFDNLKAHLRHYAAQEAPAPEGLRAALLDFVALLPPDRWPLLRDETTATLAVLAATGPYPSEARPPEGLDADDPGLEMLRSISDAATPGRWFERYGLVHGPKGGIFFGDRGEQQANAKLAAYSVNYVRRRIAARLSAGGATKP